MSMKVRRAERGWPGHFCCVGDCMFRRNTLLECDGVYIVVSTVGKYIRNNQPTRVNSYGYYETMAFQSQASDYTYHDADISKPVWFDSQCNIDRFDSDIIADSMHEIVVEELTRKLKLYSFRKKCREYEVVADE